MNINKVTLAGNLTRDPEVKFTPKGIAVCEIGMAINRVYTTGDGEKREEVNFFNVEFWGKTAENVGKYFKKGRPIYIEGRLKLDTWDDKQSGQKRYKTRIVAENFQFVGRKGDYEGGANDEQEQEQGQEEQPPRTRKSFQRKPETNAAKEPDEIPFEEGAEEDDVPF